MLTITKTREDANDVLRKLEGKVADQWAALLGGFAAIIGKKKAVQLSSTHVIFVDANGVDELNNFPHRQVTLTNTPGFIH